MTKQEIIEVIQKDVWMMEILRLVKDLRLSDWWIGAGFVRSKIWDVLHNYDKRTPLPDIDIIYLKKICVLNDETINKIKEEEREYENKLKKLHKDINWSVTNQARMHVFHKDKPYRSSEQALAQWVETATCIGVRLDENDRLILATPRGIDDLVNLKLRPTHLTPEGLKTFRQRIDKKGWLDKWPKLKVVTSSE